VFSQETKFLYNKLAVLHAKNPVSPAAVNGLPFRFTSTSIKTLYIILAEEKGQLQTLILPQYAVRST